MTPVDADSALILVVDDDPLNVEMLSAYLEDDGYRTAAAGSGSEAIQLAETARPDLILLDVMMPNVNGFDVCTTLKQGPESMFIPVVLVTALSAREDRVRGIEAGADDFLSKPVDRGELSARVRSLVRLKRSIDELESAERVIQTLAKAIEARDGYTEQHTERVTRRALALGESVGLPEHSLRVLYHGGMLHDVGKIGIPEAILGWPGPLDDGQFSTMKTHPVIGVEICRPLRSSLVQASLPIIRSHHERVDGRGYPDGLAGEDIPLLARIVAISDAYDAMTSNRPYRDGMSQDVATGILLAGAGTQWDAGLVHLFCTRVLAEVA
jgi:putative two-component system response regulator